MNDNHQCCGRDIDTPFCPYCGREGKGHTLHTLLEHCKAALATSERAFVRASARQHERSMRVKSALVRKWSAWVDALEKILNPERNKT